ncbi:MAG: type II/IV secretion system protein [Candidatus Hydrogenedentes bacterium]|nr:type II/IV secretion system protein [Candidatus Hydrogenedentota bacterium]
MGNIEVQGGVAGESLRGPLSPTKDALESLTARLAVRYGVIPLRRDPGGALVVAMEDPNAYDILDDLRMAVGCPVRAEQADPALIAEAIREFYGVGAETLDALVVNRDVQVVDDTSDTGIDDMSADASIIKFVNQLIVDAYASRATDIHLEPFERRFRVRYRIDGLLTDAYIPESIRHFRESITSRIKIMANLDIAERRLPQDGRIRVRIEGKDFDLRVSVVPIGHGESINIRILQRSSVLMGLGAIGFDEQALTHFHALLKKPHGIILLTGPTGSGKTTTLYACLSRINTADRKILTIEDPVEYQMDGICQMQVRADIGFTFASGLRSMLRHDPDVMLVGEIRDFETAELAIRCALTGHLVFSTLHTNDAPGAAPRLLDIGIEPYLLASSVEAVIGQRLVRKVCAECAEPYEPEAEAINEIGIDTPAGAGPAESSFRRGAGCDACRGTGYHGRTAIYEMMVMNDEIRRLVMEHAPGTAIKRAALANGMRTLRTNGWERARQGITTIDEVLRVTQDDRDASMAADA